MRGEDSFVWLTTEPTRGSPPHARGRLPLVLDAVEKPGITPACAGKTVSFSIIPPGTRDHPRMRGEDDTMQYRKSW